MVDDAPGHIQGASNAPEHFQIAYGSGVVILLSMTGSHIPPGDNTLAIVNLGRVSEGLTVCVDDMVVASPNSSAQNDVFEPNCMTLGPTSPSAKTSSD
mmetsp:Transcript_1366/g.4746  ORF Transcript_1366/g.4746 Transcript_1366/m.4746 type:complete len:98 (-) Transcript_1366:125-418(-)